MLFGSEARFHKKPTRTQRSSDLAVYSKDCETSTHVGPGIYFDKTIEDKRNGWISKSFSNREPMAPGRRRNGSLKIDDRSTFYTIGKITSAGIALPTTTSTETPGPGYYSPPIMKSYQQLQQQQSQRPTSASRGTMGLAARGTSSKAVIKDGMIVYGVDRDNSNNVGPGYYSPQNNTGLIKHSYNIHAQSKTPIKPTLDFPDIHRFYASNSVSGSYSASKIDHRLERSSREGVTNLNNNRSKSAPRRMPVTVTTDPVTEYYTSPMYEQAIASTKQNNRQNMFMTPPGQYE